jgi:signal transduction histidine kinase
MNISSNDFFEDLIITTDLDDKIIKVNSFLLKTLKCNSKSLIGKSQTNLFKILFSSENEEIEKNSILIFEEKNKQKRNINYKKKYFRV